MLPKEPVLLTVVVTAAICFIALASQGFLYHSANY